MGKPKIFNVEAAGKSMSFSVVFKYGSFCSLFRLQMTNRENEVEDFFGFCNSHHEVIFLDLFL